MSNKVNKKDIPLCINSLQPVCCGHRGFPNFDDLFDIFELGSEQICCRPI